MILSLPWLLSRKKLHNFLKKLHMLVINNVLRKTVIKVSALIIEHGSKGFTNMREKNIK